MYLKLKAFLKEKCPINIGITNECSEISKNEMQHNLGSLSKLTDAFYKTSSFWKYKPRRDDWFFKGAE